MAGNPSSLSPFSTMGVVWRLVRRCDGPQGAIERLLEWVRREEHSLSSEVESGERSAPVGRKGEHVVGRFRWAEGTILVVLDTEDARGVNAKKSDEALPLPTLVLTEGLPAMGERPWVLDVARVNTLATLSLMEGFEYIGLAPKRVSDFRVLTRHASLSAGRAAYVAVPPQLETERFIEGLLNATERLFRRWDIACEQVQKGCLIYDASASKTLNPHP